MRSASAAIRIVLISLLSFNRRIVGSINLLCVPIGCFLSGVLTEPVGKRRAMQVIVYANNILLPMKIHRQYNRTIYFSLSIYQCSYRGYYSILHLI